MDITRILAIYHRESKLKCGKVDYFRGYQAAMKSAVASGEWHLQRALQVESFIRTGIAMPKPVYGRNKRGKEIIIRWFESAGGTLGGFKLEAERKLEYRNRPPAIVVPYGLEQPVQVLKRRGNLTPEELARRTQVLAKAA